MVSIVDDEFVLDMEQLCEEVRVRPVIWDRTHQSYKKRTSCREAWTDLCTVMMPDYATLDNASKKGVNHFLKRRWTSARDNYLKYLKQLVEHNKFGRKKPLMYAYGEAMKFLDKVYLGAEDETELIDDGETSYVVMVQDMKNEETSFEETDINNVEEVELETSPKKKAKFTNIEQPNSKLLEINNPFLRSSADSEPEDRNMLFFKSILPSLKKLSEDEVIEFQIGVMNLLKSIKDSQKKSIGIHDNTSQCINCTTISEIETSTTS